MTASVYLRPIAFADSPQSEAGETVALSGGLIHASRFALIVRDGRRVVTRQRLGVADVSAAIAALPDAPGRAAAAQWADLQRPCDPLVLGDRVIRFDQPHVMGILNVTPDSFSDGGRFDADPGIAFEHGLAMIDAGASVIDVGGESTRPGAEPVWEQDEVRRVVPVIERLANAGAVVSIDSRRALVIGATLTAGAQIVNDVSALRHDPATAALIAKSGAAVVLMHAPGNAGNLHAEGHYDDVVFDVFDVLRERRDAAVAAGIARGRIMIDPGIGFGKTLGENLRLINALPLFHALGQPILFAASRKRMIGALSREAPADQRLGGSLALAIAALSAGAQMVRVHDVAETVQAMNVWRGLRDAALTDFNGIA